MTATNAQSGYADLLLVLAQAVQQGHKDTRTRGADGVAQSNSATAHIDIGIAILNAEAFGYGQGLGGEGFVEFEALNLIQGNAGLS